MICPFFCPDRNAPDRPGDARKDAVLLPLAKRAIREKSALMTYRGNADLSERYWVEGGEFP